MAQLSGGRFLANLNRINPMLGALLQRIIDGQNHVAQQSGIDPVGQASAPLKPSGVDVTVTGEMAHVRITDNNPTNRARNYFSEVYTDAQRTQLVHVEEHGTSRDATLNLPTFASGSTHNVYYLSSYSQVKGSPPSDRTDYQSTIVMSGATVGVIPQSSGSGTGSTTGSQPGQGFGNFQTRKATGVKRLNAAY